MGTEFLENGVNITPELQLIDIKRKAQKKSVTAINVEYNGKNINLDPAKVKIAAFTLSASLIITGIASVKIAEKAVDKISQTGKDTAYLIDYYSNYNGYLTNQGYISRTSDNKNYQIDCVGIALDLLDDGDLRDQHLYCIFKNHGNSNNTISNVVRYMGQMEKQNYNDLESYAKYRGFNSAHEWAEYCNDQILEEKEKGRTGYGKSN